MEKSTGPTFLVHDKFKLEPFCKRLEKFLAVEHDFVEGSLVVSLNAPFGSGKSTFLSMWKADLDQAQAPDRPKAIMLNAWESDYCGDPLLSVMSGLIGACGSKEGKEALHEACKDIGWFATTLLNNAVAKWTGVDAQAAGKVAEEKRRTRTPPKPNSLAHFEHQTTALQKLKEALRQSYGSECPRAFIFVDELDRCRPDYAISYLETIKHVFDIHGLVFILAVDIIQLESSAKALFGQGLNFPEYFRKFVQRSFTLPLPGEPGIRELAEHYVEKYVLGNGKRSTRLSVKNAEGLPTIERIIELLVTLNATPRQMQEIFRVLGHASAHEEEGGGYHNWGTPCGLILLSILKVLNHSIYIKIGSRSLGVQELCKYLKPLPKVSLAWWAYMYLSGTETESVGNSPAPLTIEVKNGFRDLAKSIGINIDDQGASFEDKYFTRPWGRERTADVWRLYSKIETACEV